MRTLAVFSCKSFRTLTAVAISEVDARSIVEALVTKTVIHR